MTPSSSSTNGAASGNPTTKVAREVFELQTVLKLFHWKTTSLALHEASDKLVESLLRLGDELVEAMIIRHGRPDAVGVIRVVCLDKAEVGAYLQRHAQQFWVRDFNRLVGKADTDLHSIRDEVLASIHQALYLMSLE